MVTLNKFYFMAKKMEELAKTGKSEKPVYWIGFDDK